MRYTLPRRLLATLAATLCVAATACSTSDDSTATESTTSATADVATPDTTGSPTTAAASAPATDAPDESAVFDALGSYVLTDAEFGTMVTVTVDGATRTIVTNALPDHETGEFPNGGNPNTISAQDLTWVFPTEAVFTGSATFAMTPGVAVNGVKFEPATAESVTCDSGERYPVEALQDVYDLGLDFNNAHVQPTGEYHYHGISELLVAAYQADDDLVLVGFAADGYLMYYSKSGAYEPGYELSTTPRTGTGCVGSSALGAAGVDVDGTMPDGTYGSDWVFDESIGDLDSCNGVEIDGQYAYIVTDTFPYVSRCLNGTATSAGGGAPPAGAAPDGVAPDAGPDLSEAAAALGVTEEALRSALGGPPPDFEVAAEALGVTVEELMAVLPERQ